MACMAQLVNVIAPICTENGGKAWTQTTYWPLLYGTKYGHGSALRVTSDSPTYDWEKAKNIPYLATSVIHNEEKREIVVFAVNRNPDEAMELTVDGLDNCTLAEHVELYHHDLQVMNTKDAQPVAPVSVPVAEQVVLKKHSWNMLRYTY